CLSGEDSSTCIIISARDVEIVASHDSCINSKARGSNKVKIQPVAKYDWEHKYYYGNLIAVSNSYLAYAIRGIVLLVLVCVSSVFILNSYHRDEIIVHVTRPESTPLNGNRRIIWCPFIPEENEENAEDGCQTLALLHEDRAEVWDLEIIRSNNSSWPMEATDFKEGFITVKGHNARISEGALSPDGTVLASASHDGCVKFWQIYIEGQDQPRFSPDPFNSSVLPSLKASLDLSAEYLILTDVQRKVLYVMELLQDQEKGRASFTAISEFLLTHPVLSFGIQDVSRSRQRHTEVLPAEEESESMTAGFADRLTDVSMEGLGSDKESGRGSPHDLRRISDLPAPADFLSATSDFKPKLMTPDAFMTPSASAQQQISASPGSSVSTLTAVTGMSSSCISDSVMSRTGEEMTKLSLDSSMTLSNSTGMQGSPRNNSILIPGLADQLPSKTVQVIPPANPPLSLDLQSIEPLLMPQASPTRERSPDVISSASTAMSQDIPEIASETLQRGLAASGGLPAEVLEPTLHSDSMASAASALHLLSPRNRHNSEHSHHSLDMGSGEAERLSSTPSLLETSREDVNEKHKPSPFHRHTYQLPQHDSQDASAEQSDHDDEVASLASSLGNYGSKSTHRLPVEWKSSPRGSPKLKRKSKKEEGVSDRKGLPLQMNTELQEELLSLVRCQQREISELRQSQLELMQRLTNHMDAVQSSIMGHVERVMITQQEQEQRRMERILADGHDHNRQFQEQLSQQLSQSVSNTLSNRLDKTVRDEMKKTIPQSVSKSLEPVTGQLSNTIAAKLTAVEGTLKENITKMVKSKNTTDAIGRAAADALQGPIQAAYKEAFQSIVLPVFEKGCQSMFQQINDSFKSGTQEYIQQLESHLKNRKLQEHEVRDPMMVQLQQMIDTFQNTTDQLPSNITASMRSEVQHQLHVTVGNLQDSILTQVQRIVKGEVSMAMKEQQAAVTTSIMQAMRSAAGTPIPSSHLDYQTQQANILQLLQQGQLNQAFQQALSAADLNLVLYVCETVNSQQVFGQNPCPLIQPVLLSLIQQLSTNLATRTELKISYLEDAVMNLDHGDPVTRDHMSSVLSQVRQKLFQFLQADPHNVLSKRARRLMMMLQGLINHGMS
ncbi:Enhancer of mRNA-decapping protein 4, partial [Acipenser ruthenus]